MICARPSGKPAKTIPLTVDGIVVLPDHLHCLWQLPDGDDDFSLRWRLIKSRFSLRIDTGERISSSRERKAERGILQRRFWEHAIRDERDDQTHLDYIHYNPVKHGLVHAAKDWPYSSFNRYVKKGFYSLDWGAPPEIMDLALE
jgi:putative transposase